MTRSHPRFAAKLLFAHRYRSAGKEHALQNCETRIVVFEVEDAEAAYEAAGHYGAEESTPFSCCEPGVEFAISFLGVLDLKQLWDDPPAVWHEFQKRRRPTERVSALVPAKARLRIFGGDG